ncbi:efflux transporter outer membrane subunit [Alicycliphilus denitrificans]|uniref:efflux transporter outer membrane subunit n=1 Tax=Alicycliphilus denitrificans TaxID=179636 RepID=UPI0001DA10AF|nr:efflux transporter outer membrane subunit [Alicycliphilus denitrificans]ADV01768.1 RND efflux system, outer membrane lipoprotein, NodT family [Alicycliphilus denitrificans BC]
MNITESTVLPRPRGLRLACAAAAAVLLLAGCTTLAPPYEAPAMPVPQRYAGAAEPGGAVAAATAWRDYFTDPQLQALIVQALEHNRDLRTAALRVQEARAAYGIQSAELSPAVGAQANMDRARTPADLSLTGRPMVASQYQVGLGMASWEIDFWGRVQSLRDAALENYLASDAARHAVTVSLIAQVAGGYLALRELDERLTLAEQSSASREESLRISRRRVEVGSDSRLHLTQMQTLLTQAQALVAQLSLERARQAHALGQLVGSGVALAPAAGRLAEQQMPRLAAGLPSDLLAQRPDIVAAEHQLRAAHAQIGAARAAFFPSISLTGAFGTASAELGGLFEGGSRAWTFSPSITLPIFSGGRLKGNLALAEVRRDLAVANYEKTVQQAFRDVSDALAGRQWLERQSRIAQEALAVQTERARLSQLRYDHGAAAFLDVLDAQRDLLVAQQQTVQAQRLLLSSQVSLYAALGGGALTQTHTPIEPRRSDTP